MIARPNAAQAQLPSKILSITVSNVGPQTVGEALVRANIRVKEGDQYNRNSVDDDIRNLYSTGFFLNVQVRERRDPEAERDHGGGASVPGGGAGVSPGAGRPVRS